MISDQKICNVCKKESKELEYVPSRSQLLFGGFRMKMEWRCPKCEKKISNAVEQAITNLGKK